MSERVRIFEGDFVFRYRVGCTGICFLANQQTLGCLNKFPTDKNEQKPKTNDQKMAVVELEQKPKYYGPPITSIDDIFGKPKKIKSLKHRSTSSSYIAPAPKISEVCLSLENKFFFFPFSLFTNFRFFLFLFTEYSEKGTFFQEKFLN